MCKARLCRKCNADGQDTVAVRMVEVIQTMQAVLGGGKSKATRLVFRSKAGTRERGQPIVAGFKKIVLILPNVFSKVLPVCVVLALFR